MATAALPERSGRARNVLLVLLVVLASLVFLRYAEPVLMPFVTGLFLAMLMWPLQARMQRRIPRAIAAAINLLIVLVVSGSLLAVFVFAFNSFSKEIPAIVERAQAAAGQATQWLHDKTVEKVAPELDEGAKAVAEDSPAAENPATEPFTAAEDSASSPTGLLASEGDSIVPKGERLGGVVTNVFSITSSTFADAMFILALMLLMLFEAQDFDKVLRRLLDPEKQEWTMDLLARIGHKFRVYLVSMAFISLGHGAAVWGWCAIMGLKSGLLWGLLAFVLNYIPIIGPILTIFPPSLYAIATGDMGTALGVIGGLTVIFIIGGNIIEPLVQARMLSLTAVGILAFILFWSWAWGVVGAFLAVPLAVIITVLCCEFRQTHFLAGLLGGPRILKDLQVPPWQERREEREPGSPVLEP